MQCLPNQCHLFTTYRNKGSQEETDEPVSPSTNSRKMVEMAQKEISDPVTLRRTKENQKSNRIFEISPITSHGIGLSYHIGIAYHGDLTCPTVSRAARYPIIFIVYHILKCLVMSFSAPLTHVALCSSKPPCYITLIPSVLYANSIPTCTCICMHWCAAGKKVQKSGICSKEPTG